MEAAAKQLVSLEAAVVRKVINLLYQLHHMIGLKHGV